MKVSQWAEIRRLHNAITRQLRSPATRLHGTGVLNYKGGSAPSGNTSWRATRRSCAACRMHNRRTNSIGCANDAESIRRGLSRLMSIESRAASGLNYEAEIDLVLDALAGHLDRHLDLDRILALAGWSRKSGRSG